MVVQTQLPTPVRARPKRTPIEMSREEMDKTLAEYAEKYPAVVTMQEASEITRLRPSTLYRKVSEGEFGDCVKRGKPLRFYRDGLVQGLLA